MSVLGDTLAGQVLDQEKKCRERTAQDPWRTRFHILPPTGWLNDPNGLCWYQGKYHFYFQYAPFSPEGGLKFWGAYTSTDLTDWKYEGTVLFPDSPWDCHGVYSGSALTEDGRLELFYTGNIKLDGDYDYIHDGREAYVIYTSSEDGIHFTPKECLMGLKDFPDTYTCHIRDPKVWKEKGGYRMILGGRKKSGKGAALLYRSADKKNWEFDCEIQGDASMGYMWECPDLFTLGNRQVLSISPQGMEREEYRYENIYQSGYFLLDGKLDARGKEFHLWDRGFDFYAPQTFVDQKGRRILTAWAGLPDIQEEYENPTVQNGWQHVFTTPRELTCTGERICQYPVEEIENLREEELSVIQGTGEAQVSFDLELSGSPSGSCEIQIEECRIRYEDGVMSLAFTGKSGGGRTERKARIPEGVDSLRILADASLLEVYVNHGAYVFTTRFYPEDDRRRIRCRGTWEKMHLYQMKK